MDFGSILENIKKFIAPQVPPSQPLQQGQSVSDFPGYQAPQSPPQQFDFQQVGNFLGNAAKGVGDWIGNMMPSQTYHYDFRSPTPDTTAAPTTMPSVAPTATPQPMDTPGADGEVPADLEGVIRKAMQAYGNPPVATLSGELAQAGQGLPDPLLPAIVSLKESSGGKHLTHPNNFVNILDPRGADYSSPAANLIDNPGDNRFSFSELMKQPAYAQYRDSGNLADFFSKYTPDHDRNGNRNSNATIADQIKMYNQLKDQYFAQ